MTIDTRQPGAGPPRRPGWHDPHQLAGRSRGADLALGLVIFIGALADAVAFKTTLDILLRLPELWSWVMAAGATCLALVAAAKLGVAIAVRRRDDTRYASFVVAAAAIAWLGLGLAMFATRLLGNGSPGPAFGTAPQTTQSHPLAAIFFGAIYLISGACMMVEAQRLHNPEAVLFRRLGKRHDKQVAITAAAEAVAVRAQQAVDLHNDELDREDARRQTAITARRALGAEAANHARLSMAALLSGPGNADITKTGPVLELPPTVSPPVLPPADDDPDRPNR